MAASTALSLHTLPIELVCRVLDHLEHADIFLSVREVCSRLNAITDTYQPYQVPILFILHKIFETAPFICDHIYAPSILEAILWHSKKLLIRPRYFPTP